MSSRSDCPICGSSWATELHPTPHAAGPWIPVAERLPEVGEDVLVYTERHGAVCCAKRDSAGWYVAGFDGIDGVTHWAPLYPPSEGEK